MHDVVQCIKSDFTLSDIGMAVLVCTAWIFAVIDMKDCDLIFSDDPVKFLYDGIKIVDDIITGIVGMAGIKADTKPLRVRDTVVDSSQFLETAADFRSFSGHGSRAIQQSVPADASKLRSDRGYLCRPCFHTGSHMGTRMQDQDVTFHGSSTLYFQCEKIDRQFKVPA